MKDQHVEQQIEILIQRHRLPCPRKKVLEPRHAHEEFLDAGNDADGQTRLFYRYARAVCRANKIPRKELFEAWGMALHVHQHFPDISRFADLACGHGLLSWALLVLYSCTDKASCSAERHSNRRLPVSAVCIDIHMPAAAQRLEEEMLKEWPELSSDQWHYVEGSISGILPSPDTLLVGIHACKTLSDTIITNAIYGNSPLALVPCCHSKSCLTKQQQELFADNSLGRSFLNLASFIDYLRVQTLEAAGYQVEKEEIAEAITPKNKIIIAKPQLTRPGPTIRFDASSRNSKITIPLADTVEARAFVTQLSGKDAAQDRKIPEPIMLGLVLCLPPGQDVLASQLEALAKQEIGLAVQVHSITNGVFHHIANGTFSRTFQVHYPQEIDKETAIEKHINFCHTIPLVHPEVRVRQIPRLQTVLSLVLGMTATKDDGKSVTPLKEAEFSDLICHILSSMGKDDIHTTVTCKKTLFRRKNGRYTQSARICYKNISKAQANDYHDMIKERIPQITTRIEIVQ